jgi:hypothetical protein
MSVDALVVGQLAADGHVGVDLLASHSIHRQDDQAVVQQQHVARLDVLWQFFVVQPNAVNVAGLGA